MVGRKVINTFLPLPKTRHFHFTIFIYLILKHFEFGNVIFYFDDEIHSFCVYGRRRNCLRESRD